MKNFFKPTKVTWWGMFLLGSTTVAGLFLSASRSYGTFYCPNAMPLYESILCWIGSVPYFSVFPVFYLVNIFPLYDPVFYSLVAFSLFAFPVITFYFFASLASFLWNKFRPKSKLPLGNDASKIE